MEYQNSPESCRKGPNVMTSDRFYELLGVSPGASRQELKAAYRDLTKVWHPDRFAHDPRLQQKAEEKLKEINEAYEHLISGKTRRLKTTHPTRTSHMVVQDYSGQSASYSPVVPPKSRSLVWLLAPLIVFGCVFAFTIRFLHARVTGRSATLLQHTAPERDAGTSDAPRPLSEENNRQSDRRSTEASIMNPSTNEQQRLATTSVIIDSTTGLLARDECPTKIKMSYPTGSEPHAYCNIHPVTRSASNPQQQ